LHDEDKKKFNRQLSAIGQAAVADDDVSYTNTNEFVASPNFPSGFQSQCKDGLS